MKNWLSIKNIAAGIVFFTMVLFFTLVVAEHSVGATKRPDQPAIQEAMNPLGPAEAEVSQGFQRGRQVTLEATGYTCGPESTGKYPSSPDYCKTASGYRLQPGDKVVAMGEKYPFGTSVVVPGYGVAIVRDRGGAVSDNHIDLYFDRPEDALNWGRRIITVTIR